MWNIQNNVIEPYWVIRQSMAPLKLSRWQMTKLFAKAVVADLPTGALVLMASAILLLTLYFKTRSRLRLPSDLPVVEGRNSHFEDILKAGREKVSTKAGPELS
jgi:hypothetical protein